MSIYLEVIGLTIQDEITRMVIKCEMRYATDFFLGFVVVITLRVDVMAVIKREIGGKPLVCIIGRGLDAGIGEPA